MPSATLVEDHRQEIADIVAVAQADLVETFPSLPLDDAPAAKRATVSLLTELLHTYGPMAAGAGADWYSEARFEAGTRGAFTPRLNVPILAPQIETNVGWALSPLYGEADADAALSRLSGVTQRLTANADRATILTNTRRDPAGVRWYRGTSAKCCAFCAMVASRGAVYRSEQSAEFKAHNSCHCFPVVLFPGDTHELPSYYKDFRDEYETAAEKVVADGGKRTQSAVLREWRQQTGRH